MNIVVAEPPLMGEIDARFHVRGKAVIFAWGDTIYNPQGIHVELMLLAHEGLHGTRQTHYRDHTVASRELPVVQWWRRYLEDEPFRYWEEVEAHRAELAFASAGIADRNQLARLLDRTARRLASPIYAWEKRPLYLCREDVKPK